MEQRGSWRHVPSVRGHMDELPRRGRRQRPLGLLVPRPRVVTRETSGSWTLTKTPSLLGRGSVSMKSTPYAIAARTAPTVFSGAITPMSPPIARVEDRSLGLDPPAPMRAPARAGRFVIGDRLLLDQGRRPRLGLPPRHADTRRALRREDQRRSHPERCRPPDRHLLRRCAGGRGRGRHAGGGDLARRNAESVAAARARRVRGHRHRLRSLGHAPLLQLPAGRGRRAPALRRETQTIFRNGPGSSSWSRSSASSPSGSSCQSPATICFRSQRRSSAWRTRS
jgi:hypothetical protein